MTDREKLDLVRLTSCLGLYIAALIVTFLSTHSHYYWSWPIPYVCVMTAFVVGQIYGRTGRQKVDA